MLTASDPVIWRPRRITIAGIPGSGKTTLARRLSASLGLPFVEMDKLFIGPKWQPRPEFEADVDSHIAGDSWVVEWQYPSVRDRIAASADTLLWLDIPSARAVRQLAHRTVRRRLSGEELWNGNREMPLPRLLYDKNHIIWWTVRNRRMFRELVPAAESKFEHLHVVRLRSYVDADLWVDNARQASIRLA